MKGSACFPKMPKAGEEGIAPSSYGFSDHRSDFVSDSPKDRRVGVELTLFLMCLIYSQVQSPLCIPTDRYHSYYQVPVLITRTKRKQ